MSDVGSTKIKTVVLKGCVNKQCHMYVGDDQNNPNNIQERSESAQDSADI